MKKIFEAIVEWLKSLFAKEEPAETESESSGADGAGWEVIVITGGTNTPEPPVEPPVINTGNTQMENHRLVVLLDNGHASSTPGKRSPVLEDGRQFFEYEFNRDVVHRIARKLDAIGMHYEILVPEVDEDISLTNRANRANAFCEKYGTKNCIFLSIHANASGNGDQWKKAKGWCCFTSKGETKADPYAEIFMVEARKTLAPLGLTIRTYSQQKYSWEENFTVLVKTNCPAILTESFFYDNRDEVEFLLSDEGRETIAQIHVNALLEIEKKAGLN